MVEAEPSQASCGRPLEIGGRQIGMPHFRGEEDLVAWNERRPDAGAHRGLIVIHARRIDVPVSRSQCVVHEIAALVAL